jgi:formate-dependent nitrite reductase cytochrome c552 subunit
LTDVEQSEKEGVGLSAGYRRRSWQPPKLFVLIVILRAVLRHEYPEFQISKEVVASQLLAATHHCPSNVTCHTPFTSVNNALAMDVSWILHKINSFFDQLGTLCSSCWKQIIAPLCAVNVRRTPPVSEFQIRRVASAAAETR